MSQHLLHSRPGTQGYRRGMHWGIKGNHVHRVYQKGNALESFTSGVPKRNALGNHTVHVCTKATNKTHQRETIELALAEESIPLFTF